MPGVVCAAAEPQEAVGLLTAAFQSISIKGQQVGLPSPGTIPPFALRENAGGGGRAGKPTGMCARVLSVWAWCRS